MDIIEIVKAVLFGIVEGISEWLPISSTGHLLLLNEILPLRWYLQCFFYTARRLLP